MLTGLNKTRYMTIKIKHVGHNMAEHGVAYVINDVINLTPHVLGTVI